MKEIIRKVVYESLKTLDNTQGVIVSDIAFDIQIPKNEKFGDYSTNAAMILSGKTGEPPRDIASKLVESIKTCNNTLFSRVDIAGPGFINFYVDDYALISRLCDISESGENWGCSDTGQGEKVLVEFVSANPTGYLHFGHARNAVVGDSVCRILTFAGFDVTREFYINDSGRQMEMLGESVLCKYLEIYGISSDFPEDGYRGEYIYEIAQDLAEKYGDKFTDVRSSEAADFCTQFAYEKLLSELKTDLERLDVRFDSWFSEKERIHNTGNFDLVRKKLEGKNAIDSRDGALWFLSTKYGDDQDWVLVKKDGRPTYFFADIVYHDEKFKRGYNRMINIWGADHHSHFSRLRSSMKAMGHNAENLEVLLIQFVRLVREGKEVSMSKRAGSFVTLREVLEEVGRDVTRFFLLMRSSDSHLDFDLDLAKSQSNENPVYYVQYAHARIMSVFKKAETEGVNPSSENLQFLTAKDELEITKKLILFPEIVRQSAKNLTPHKITYYLQELASDFHIYYNKNKIVGEDTELSSARLYLADCIRIVLSNGLRMLGVDAPARM